MKQSVIGFPRRLSKGGETSWSPASLLGSLDAATREALLELGSPGRYRADAALMRQGDPDTHVVVLRSGKVKVTATSEKGDVTLLAIRGPGDVVGELAAIQCGPRSATVTASTPVTCKKIPQPDFRAFLAEHPPAALALAQIVGRHLIGANERRVEFASYPVKVRLARVLTQFGRQHGRPTPRGLQLDVKLTQAELAGLTGARCTAIQKAFRELRRNELVDTVYGQITIMRPETLEQVAGYSADPSPT